MHGLQTRLACAFRLGRRALTRLNPRAGACKQMTLHAMHAYECTTQPTNMTLYSFRSSCTAWYDSCLQAHKQKCKTGCVLQRPRAHKVRQRQDTQQENCAALRPTLALLADPSCAGTCSCMVTLRPKYTIPGASMIALLNGSDLGPWC